MNIKLPFQWTLRWLLVLLFLASTLLAPVQSASAQPLFAGFNCTAVTGISSAECAVLVALYSGTGGATWTDHTGWLQTLTPCSWYGVSCAAGKVDSLILSSNALSGVIPAELGSLTDLAYLDLSSNALTGSIPVELGALTKLISLRLNNNQLIGAIPAQLGDLTSLQTLYLYSNQLTDPIPGALGSLTNLTVLNLNSNALSGAIPAQLGSLTNLTMLDLNSNVLSGAIPEALGTLANLTNLSLSSNSLTGSIPLSLRFLTKLTNLNLGSNELSGDIVVELSGLTNLTYLSFSNNALSGAIPSGLGNLTNLEYLDLRSNAFTGSIPAALGSMTNLKGLYLSSNTLSGAIPGALGSLTNLEYLDLSYNTLSGAIPGALGSLTKLKNLYLASNALSGAIPAALGSLTDLTGLALYDNQLSGAIPPELGSLTKLTYLGLNTNQLSGEIPTSITNLVNLTTFSFDHCDGLYSTNAAVVAFLNPKAPNWNVCGQTISGNAGVGGAILSFTDGSPKSFAADASGNYSIPVTYYWSGTVTPSKAGYTFLPVNKSYTDVIANQTAQNFTARNIITVSSDGAQDGWVLESTEASKAGGSLNATDPTLRLGDDKTRKQYRSILSFATGVKLPDNAVITSVTLRVKKHSITGGGDPLTTLQGFMVDIKKGIFGTAALQTADFQTAATKSIGPVSPVLASGWYAINLTSGKASINKLPANSGLTQIRLRFNLDDNNNAIANYLSLFSGNAPAASRPQLVIEYTMP